jgi:hypothetical protein
MADGTVTSASNFYGQDASLRHIADKHFPNDCLDRWLLLEAADSFDHILPLYHQLELIRQQLERLAAIEMPDSVDIRYMATCLERSSRAIAKHDEESRLLKRASAVLTVWCDLTFSLRELLALSRDYRVLDCQPGGSA